MTSIVSSMPSFSDLPIEIITYILSLCECDIIKECNILDFNTKKGRLTKSKIYASHDARHSYPMAGPVITEFSKELFKKSPTCLGPVTLTKLESVNRDFRIASAPLWEKIYIHNLRNDKPFKRKYTHEQYKQKYRLYILKKEQNKLDFILEQHKYAEIMTMIKSNNAARYFETIKKAVEEDKLNITEIYTIDHLLQYNRFSVETNYVRDTSLRLRNIENVIHYRRKAIQERDYFKELVSKYDKTIAKNRRIINSLC